MPDSDHKVKAISKLVMALIVLTSIVLALVAYLSWKSQRVASGYSEPLPGCGVVDKPGKPTDYCFSNYNGHDGKALFKANCSSCHSPSDKKITGPGLKDVLGRIPGGNWRYQFVRNADSLLKAGDAYTVKISNEYNHLPHTRFPQLTNDEIDAILGR